MLVEPFSIVEVKRQPFGGFWKDGFRGVSDLDTSSSCSSFALGHVGLSDDFVKLAHEDVGSLQSKGQLLDKVDFPIRDILLVTVSLGWTDDVDISLGEIVGNSKLESLFAELCYDE